MRWKSGEEVEYEVEDARRQGLQPLFKQCLIIVEWHE
jgi:hypothetical protein